MDPVFRAGVVFRGTLDDCRSYVKGYKFEIVDGWSFMYIIDVVTGKTVK